MNFLKSTFLTTLSGALPRHVQTPEQKSRPLEGYSALKANPLNDDADTGIALQKRAVEVMNDVTSLWKKEHASNVNTLTASYAEHRSGNLVEIQAGDDLVAHSEAAEATLLTLHPGSENHPRLKNRISTLEAHPAVRNPYVGPLSIRYGQYLDGLGPKPCPPAPKDVQAFRWAADMAVMRRRQALSVIPEAVKEAKRLYPSTTVTFSPPRVVGWPIDLRRIQLNAIQDESSVSALARHADMAKRDLRKALEAAAEVPLAEVQLANAAVLDRLNRLYEGLESPLD